MSLINKWAENEIIRKVVNCLLANGKGGNKRTTAGVVLTGDFDEAIPEIFTTADAVLAELDKWNISEFYVHQIVNSASAKKFLEGDTGGQPWVKFVYGNGPEAIISDYNVGIEATIKPALEMAEAFDGADLAKLAAIIKEVVAGK